jgi:hypothetical protein
MLKTNHKRRASTLSKTLLAAGLLGIVSHTNAANAAAFTFTPTGSQLDADTILDIVLQPGQPIRFEYSVSDISGLTLADGNFLDLFYSVSWDSGELTYQGLGTNPGFPPPQTSLPQLLYVGKAVANPASSGGFDIVFQEGIPGIDFIGADVNPWPGDGLSDFTLSLDRAELRQFQADVNPTSVTALFNPKNQIVEVQKTPGPLPLLGVGAAFGFSSNLRKRIKGSKSPEAMSAIG